MNFNFRLEQGMKGAQHVMQQALNFILNADKVFRIFFLNFL